MTVPLSHALAVAAILLSLGLVGVLVRRNLLFMLVAVEVMLNAAGLAFVAVAAARGTAEGQVMFLFILAMAAAEVAVGLALILQIHHRARTADADRVDTMRG